MKQQITLENLHARLAFLEGAATSLRDASSKVEALQKTVDVQHGCLEEARINIAEQQATIVVMLGWQKSLMKSLDERGIFGEGSVDDAGN